MIYRQQRTQANNHTIKNHTRPTTYIRKSVLHSFRTGRHRKRHSHSLPRYNPDCTIPAQITTNQITIHPTADKNHITLSCQSGSQYSPRFSHSKSIHPNNHSPNTPTQPDITQPHSHFRNLCQSGITFCTTQ